MTTTWPRILTTLLDGASLTSAQAAWAMDQIMSGLATDAQIAAFAVALRAKGETVAEVSGLADGMLAKALAIRVPGDPVDLVGTGGDRANTVNVSTMAAIVTAAAGAKVVKHGGRAASSMAGAADVLEELGVVIDLPPAAVVRVADEVGITFCFAAAFNPALRRTSRPRRELGVPTVFNFLGPLTNPALPSAQAVGVFHASMAPTIAGVLAERGCSALVFRGDDGLDELTTCGPSSIWVVRRGRVTPAAFDPLDLAIPRARIDDLRGGDARHNAGVARAVLSGERGPVRDIVLLNAAAALVAADGTPPAAELTPALAAGYKRAADAVDSGAALSLLTRWAHATRQEAAAVRSVRA
ncbi:Anthranilate phosphoribosyltransferase [[Actinomadura] parvosata subsp. kistnae]|uniref:Anthranilate phosphoribosyltransferase n=1 Tax=[Actinomadura] parvosata subsp. kistnae TaxID=1909395 RepID=A0A1V0AEV5_9ACTN|nr:anthranilate phosphoribosyltransferase [Nonomuraea sp. ATCC 55076]AQZ68760.1 anthranilate phosphoribosyltransferase [Nonomuraea sp. ATCC 55076]SPL92736.1 Anthranilate phosphoribosyltransferase [Actinomadura parvosata subsp. kistnae]